MNTVALSGPIKDDSYELQGFQPFSSSSLSAMDPTCSVSKDIQSVFLSIFILHFYAKQTNSTKHETLGITMKLGTIKT